MAARYVPPGRRGKPEVAAGEKPPIFTRFDDHDSLLSLEDIRAHFWPVKDEGLPVFSATAANRTMHDSAATPGKLAYLILFQGANPQWEAENVIFTKSSLDLLPAHLANDPGKAPSVSRLEKPATGPPAPEVFEEEQTASTNAADDRNTPSERETNPEPQAGNASNDLESPQSPIAVFKQVGKVQHGRYLRFHGWYQIGKLSFVEPGSPELVKLLEKKWTKTDRFGNARQEQRSEEGWKESLRHHWAVLKLKEDEVAEKDLGVPKVERLPDLDPESPKVAKKSVNEMLAELRMNDQKPNGTGKGPA